MSNEAKTSDNTVYVLWWRHYDGSDAGVVRVYDTKRAAEEQKAILEKYGQVMMRFEVSIAPYSSN